VTQALRGLKAARRREERARCARNRVSHRVLARDALWAQDATHLGGGVYLEVIRDVASCRILALSIGRPATGRDVIVLLEAARRERGTLPLVWQTDNAKAYTCRAVRAYLRRNRVIHLRSRVRTPTDNGAMERGIGELHEELQGARGVEDLALACTTLNEGRLRATRGYRTASEVDAALRPATARVRRRVLYRRACAATWLARSAAPTARAKRAAERAALWALLERHGLALRTGPETEAPEPIAAAAPPRIR
jgi:transposase InsO family protein